MQALEQLGVDVQNLVSLADHLFEMDDHHEHHDNIDGPGETGGDSEEGKSMTFADFLEMVIRLRADNTPFVADIVELRKLIFKAQRALAKHFTHMDRTNADMQ